MVNVCASIMSLVRFLSLQNILIFFFFAECAHTQEHIFLTHSIIVKRLSCSVSEYLLFGVFMRLSSLKKKQRFLLY